MIKRPYLTGIAIFAVALGLWTARAAWRAHKDIVTLDVRNMPLADVAARLQRQTREKIIIDGRLDETVTLNVDDMALLEVLEKIGRQVGAVPSTVHAIHNSESALSMFTSALRQGDLASADGWTNLAPHLSSPVGETAVAHAGPPMQFRANGEGPGPMLVEEDVRHVPGPGGLGKPMQVGKVRRVIDGVVHEELIMPERIVMQADLEARLRNDQLDQELSPDLLTARAVARKADANCTTFYTLRKSAVAGVAGNMMSTFRLGLGPDAPTGTNRISAGPPSMEDIERNARREQLSRFQDSTPEQRARRAREVQGRNRQP